MGFLNGVYTPPSGAEDAIPGEVIRSATWNTIFTDISANGLSVLGGRAWVTNPPRTVASGSFTVLTTDVAVFVSAPAPTITLPPASLMTSPFAIISGSASIFGGIGNSAAILSSGGDIFNGGGATLVVTNNALAMTFYPIAGGYVTSVVSANSPPNKFYVGGKVDFNVANTDTAFSVPTFFSGNQYQINTIKIGRANHTLTSSTFGIFTSPAGAGTTIVASGTACALTGIGVNTPGNIQNVTIANASSTSSLGINSPVLYFRVQNAEGTAATATVNIEFSSL